jgi:CDP-diacylglycerol--serine O-phosphatidyltransferase
MSKTKFVVPNAFTSISFLLAVWSPLIVSGVINVEKPLWLAANFILFCVLLDKLDGFAARLLNASSEFGAQLDSMADLIAFGVAPGFLLVFGFKYNNLSWYLDNQIKVMVVASVFIFVRR